MRLFKWLSQRLGGQENASKAPKAEPKELIDPEDCDHPEWSPSYDLKTYPGAVKNLEVYCLKCGMPERGSCQ